jgi:hypothetical protein
MNELRGGYAAARTWCRDAPYHFDFAKSRLNKAVSNSTSERIAPYFGKCQALRPVSPIRPATSRPSFS